MKKIQRITTMLSLCATVLVITPTTFAQEDGAQLEEVVVKGIRRSLASALEEKRESDNLVELIQAEDIGKLPDQNLAEVLENVPGIQITRQAGVGTGVQIRGTDENRTEINGVSTVGSGSAIVGAGSGSRSMNFDDISSAIISAVEVIKVPEAKTIEGSVGGTINLRTIRPLELDDMLLGARVQGENSSLSTDSTFQPRFSGAFGDNWSTEVGDVGVVISGSWSEQDVTAFRPRTDRDNSVASTSGQASAQTFNFLPIQFLLQDNDNFEYETVNVSGSFEWAPNDDLTLFFDAVYNDQERRQESSRMQASGVSSLASSANAIPDTFETVNFGTIDGQNGAQDLGSIEAALRGVIGVDLADDDDDPNLRFSGDTGSRLTDNKIFRLGGEWDINDRLSVRLEGSMSENETISPDFNTTLNFINPNAPLDPGGANDNSTPFRYDLSGGQLAWDVAFGEPFAPTPEQLTDPANVVLQAVNIGRDFAKNTEDAVRFDFSYNADWGPITSVEVGYRWNETSSVNNDISTNARFRTLAESPRGNLFTDILVRGPTNFSEADGRSLSMDNSLLIDPELVADDPDGVLDTINAAIAENNAISGTTFAPLSSPTSETESFFDITEETHAFYAQANFEYGMFRGNAGLRYLETDVASSGNTVINNVATATTTNSSYNFLLPRINLVADVHEDVVIRAGYSKDIRRPEFADLATSFEFETSPNPPVELGNPGLEPEEVESFDLSAEWYFAPGSVLSIALFHKERTGLFVRTQDNPFEDPVTGFRDLTDPCEGGGIFNPIADINVFGPLPGAGVCVPVATNVNGAGETTQKGIEVTFQYDFAQHENRLGWASGFGILANLTLQDFEGPDTFLTPTSRARTAFGLTSTAATNVTLRANLTDLSETAYNITGYYEKYGISARVRYTWREAYRSEDFGSTESFPWGFPVIQEDRGQLNASINYDVFDNWNVGVEAVNITESDVVQRCVNDGALLCFQGLTDRRIILGISYRH